MYPGMRLLLAVLFLLIVAPAAHAGGFATVGLSSTPTGTDWPVEITVLQHGRTPLDNVTPRVVITQGATTRTFAGEPTGKPGVYAARVVFPGGGRWEYSVLDGFTDVIPHTFPAVTLPGRVAYRRARCRRPGTTAGSQPGAAHPGRAGVARGAGAPAPAPHAAPLAGARAVRLAAAALAAVGAALVIAALATAGGGGGDERAVRRARAGRGDDGRATARAGRVRRAGLVAPATPSSPPTRKGCSRPTSRARSRAAARSTSARRSWRPPPSSRPTTAT